MKEYTGTPFTYFLYWTKTNTWYYGSRYANGCKLTDLWTTYFTSSIYVKQHISLYGDPDLIKIRKIFETGEEAVIWENRTLKKLKKFRKTSLNKRFGSSCFVPTKESIENNIKSKRSRSPEHQEIVRKNISNGIKEGHKNMSEETKKHKSNLISESNKNRSDETKSKIANSVSKYWNGLSANEQEEINDKRRKKFKENKENGIKRKSPRISYISCLCCQKQFDPGNFSKHIRRSAYHHVGN